MFIRLLLPVLRAVTINTTRSLLCLPHRTSTAKIHLTTLNHTHALSLLFVSGRLHSHSPPFLLDCPAPPPPFFLVLSRFVALAFCRPVVMNLAGSHAARSNSVMLQYIMKSEALGLVIITLVSSAKILF